MRLPRLLLPLLAGCFPEVAIQAPDDTGGDCAWYADGDGDGWGDVAEQTGPCADRPADAADAPGDCDDADAAVHPGATETCDGLDEDCDGLVDEDAGETWYRDADGDGYGDPADVVVECTAPPGTTGQAGDCDDDAAQAHPGAAETWYDGVDGDCDGGSDYDADGDGWDRDDGGVGDCDDTDPAIHPEAPETWYDGVDGDCDGGSDLDADGDGHDDLDHGGDDCGDDDPLVFPGSHATEVPGDGVDTDCDGVDACTDLSCDGRPDLVLPGYQGPDGAYADTLLYFSVADADDPALHAWDAAADAGLAAGAVVQAAAADLDGDGYRDLVLAVHHDSTGEATDSWVYWGSGAGYADTDRSALPTEAAAALCLADVDGDGDTDLFFGGASEAGGVTSMLYLNVGGVFSPQALPLVRSRACLAADLDGDGADELVVGRAPDDEGRVDPETGASVLVHDGSTATFHDLPGVDVRRIAGGDIDGDGLPDFVLVDHGSEDEPEVKQRVFTGDAGVPVQWGQAWGVRAVDAAFFDADGDGDTDLVVLSGGAVDGALESSETVAWLQSGGGLSDGGVTPSATTPGATRLTAADLNGDGDTELVVSNFVDDAGSYALVLRLFEVTSSGRITLSGSRDLPTQGGRGHAVADLDGDGDLDVVSGAWSDDAGSGRVDSRIYWNGGNATVSNAFQTLDRTGLTTTAIWGEPLVVGAE